MLSQAYLTLRERVLALLGGDGTCPPSGPSPFGWGIAVLAGVAFSFFLTGCSKTEPSTNKTVAPGSTSAAAPPTARVGGTSQSTRAFSKDALGGALSRERSVDRTPRTSGEANSRTKPRRPFTPAEIKAAGRVYATVQEKRESLLTREDSVEENKEKPTSEGSPASGLPPQIPQMQKQMIRAMASALSEESELSPTRFRRLMNRAMSDSLLRDRFFEAIQKAGGESPSPQAPSSP